MDEMMIHSARFSDEPDEGYRQSEASRPGVINPEKDVESFILQLGDGVSCTVYKRPGLDDFLRACSEEFETHVFTAGTQGYAEPLLDHLDPDRTLIKGRFYRADCRPVKVWGGQTQFLKDLSAVTPELHRTVLVDNNPLSFVCQPSNGIPVPDFVGKSDQILPAVLRLLRQLAPLEDVRPTLDTMFELQEQLRDMRTRLLGPGPSKL